MVDCGRRLDHTARSLGNPFKGALLVSEVAQLDGVLALAALDRVCVGRLNGDLRSVRASDCCQRMRSVPSNFFDDHRRQTRLAIKLIGAVQSGSEKGGGCKVSSETVFASGPDFALNACVGHNTGSSDDSGYVTGFAQAALVLIAAAKVQYFNDPTTGDEITVYQDALIYPICFNARHHIELFLKRQIRRVAALRDAEVDESILGGHELGKLLEKLNALCESVDRRLPRYLEPLKAAITVFAEVDPTGQTFRYRHSIDDHLHLEHLQHINLAQLEGALKDLFAGTEEFERQSDALVYEYGQGTTTPELSREELNELAMALPERSEWATSSRFDEVKGDILNRLGLSGKAFSRAVELIQTHYEFAGHIGMQLPRKRLGAAP